jgi:aerobic-type carbon monoxide dehydrogenase small subunit (CoxS/CutS family)
MPPITMTVNGRTHVFELGSEDLLLDVLRDHAGCSSVREGCGVGVCGTCTAIVNGSPVSTCLLLGATCDGAEVRTVEGLSPEDPVVAAFGDVGAMQCGYCTPGFVLMVRDLLSNHPSPSPDAVDDYLAGNLCRCVAYLEIRESVRRLLVDRDEAIR